MYVCVIPMSDERVACRAVGMPTREPPVPGPVVLHERALLAYLAAAHRFLLGLQRYVPILFQIEQLLKQLLHVVVGLGRRLHEMAAPSPGLRVPVLGRHLSGVVLVALVAHQHDRDRRQLGRAFRLFDHLRERSAD